MQSMLIAISWLDSIPILAMEKVVLMTWYNF